MQGIPVVNSHSGAKLQFTAQPPQIGHAFVADTALTVVLVLVSSRALQTRVKSIHRSLLGIPVPKMDLAVDSLGYK